MGYQPMSSRAGSPCHVGFMTQLAAATRTQKIDAPLALVRSLAPIGGAILIALLVHGIGAISGQYPTRIMLDCGVAIIAAVSLTIVNGFTGQFSIGHAAFMAVGGYASGMVTYYTLLRHLDPAQIREIEPSLLGGPQFMLAASCLIGGLIAAAAGWLVGLPSLRLKGDYLAIVTLGFGEIVRVLLTQTDKQIDSSARFNEVGWAGALWPPAANGALGFDDLPKVTNLFWTYLFVAATVLIAFRIKTSSYGRALLSIREDEIAAESMGVNTARMKIRAFVLAAFLAGVAGTLYAHEPGNKLTPTDAGFQRSFDIIMMVVLGGLGSISGSALAAILIIGVGEWLRAPTHVWHVGLALIVVRAILGAFDVVYPRRTTLRACLTLGGLILLVEGVRALAIYKEINLGDYRMVMFALMLIFMMIFRPKGFFGLNEVWDVLRHSPPHVRGVGDRK